MFTFDVDQLKRDSWQFRQAIQQRVHQPCHQQQLPQQQQHLTLPLMETIRWITSMQSSTPPSTTPSTATTLNENSSRTGPKPKVKFCIDDILRPPLKQKQQPIVAASASGSNPRICKSSSSDPNSPKKYQCQLCCKSFDRRWLLQGHIRTHTGEKPYKCNVCNKTFADKSNLRAHTQTHSGLKRYKCLKCGRGFTLRSYLNKHLEARCQPDPPCFQPNHVFFY